MKKNKTKVITSEIANGNRNEYFQEEARFEKTIKELDNVSNTDIESFKESRKQARICEEIKAEQEATKVERKSIFLEKTQEINLNEIEEFQKRQNVINYLKDKNKKELKKRYITIRNKSVLG
ncbi:MAG: hypothetical protein RSA40_01640 [Malacoplasma sp.]